MQANYTEDLTTTWYIAGDGNGTGDGLTPGSPFTGWGTSGTPMYKKTGHSTEEIYYCDIMVSTVATTDDHFPFQVFDGTNHRGYNNFWITNENNSTTIYTGNPTNMKFRPYITGTYTFKVDNTGTNPVLTVTWPEINQVRISTASPTDAANTGNYDLSEPVSNVRSVTRSLNANTTYTFKVVYNSGWYGYNDGTFTRSTSTSSNSLTVSSTGGDMTLTTDYAGYYTFKFNQSDNGLSVDFPAAYKVTYGKGTVDGSTGSCSAKDIDNSNASVTSNSTWVKSGHRVVLTAPEAATGYTYTGWFDNTAGTGTAITTNANCTITVSSAQTLYACYTLNNHTVTYTAPSNGSYTIQVGSATAVSMNTTSDYGKTITLAATPATGYHFTGWTVTKAGGGTITPSSSASANPATFTMPDENVTIAATFAVNTYTIVFDPNDARYAGPDATGSTASISATYGTSYTLTANGFSREGYTFAGWNTNPDGTSGTNYIDAQTGVSNLTETHGATVTLYAKWTGKLYTVTFNARGGSGLSASSSTVTMGSAYSSGIGLSGTLPTVTPPAGYVFDGWYTAATGGTKVTDETLVVTASDHTLYAHYVQKAQVYFKNTLGWENVYVTFDATWDGSQGAGNKGKTYRTMTQIPGTDIWYHDIPDNYLSSWAWNIAFNNTFQSEYYAFTAGEAVFRYDFDKKATMFVPTNKTDSMEDGNFNDVNGVQYRSTGYAEGSSSNPKYTSGYWRTYNNTYSGYTMTYQKNGSASWSSGHKMECANVGDNTFIYTVHMDANSQYNFAFYKEKDVNTKSVQFNYRTEITSTACTDLKLVCDPNNAWMQTTVEGDYVFKLRLEDDGHMYLTVDYPFAANDYRVVYTWNDGSAHTYESEIIRAAAGTNETISVFVHKAESPIKSRSLKIQECTDISSSGTATWTDVTGATIALTDITESGVYDFIITQPASGDPTGAYYDKYTGNYYIRTDASDGGWDMYKYRPDNIMTLSKYSLTQTLSEPYSHYYCRYIESTDIDITYAVATDYSPNISGKLVGDETIGGVSEKTLPASANVRFTWNEETNGLFRAYLKSAQGTGNTRFLVLHGKAADNIFNADADGTAIAADGDRSLAANELLFADLGNWIYQVNLKAKPQGAVSLIANYNGSDRYLIGGDDSWMEIMGGDGSNKYDILAVYDFKTNRLMTVWTPSGDISDALEDVDMLLVRHAQDNATSVTFSSSGSLTTKKVYGAIELRYDELVGRVANWTTDSRPLLKYMISFPFDVNISDIFGLNTRYGEAYIIQKYDGEDRAARGFFRGDGTTTFWKTMAQNDVLKANVGYSVIMDNDYLNNDMGHVWDNKSAGSSVYLYFPSAGDVGAISSSTKTITVTGLPCTIDREFTVEGRTLNHKYTDSNWNLIGVPIFQNSTGVTSSATITYPENTSNQTGSYGPFYYFYDYDVANNSYSIASATGYNFKTMYGYMLQYAGTVTFTGSTPSSVAARRIADTKKYEIELQVLNSENEMLNRTFVNLKENACDTFALNEDVYMSPNSAAVNIYTFAGNYDVAANVLSVDNHVIPVGVEVNKAGTYTFSMPSNFSGKVTLIDNFTGEHTDLSISDYEVELPKSVIEDRFMLEINIEKVTTAIDGINGEGTLKDGKAHKFLQNGIMYILRNGILYDAQGKRVQ